MVAAGGGGCTNYINPVPKKGIEGSGGCGGGLVGCDGNYSLCVGCENSSEISIATGATQDAGGYTKTSKGELGLGANAVAQTAGGGGGGYFGGAAGAFSKHKIGSGSGGSSFISGHDGCHAFTSANNDSPSKLTSIHYSGLFFTNTDIKNGTESFMSPSGQMEAGHLGNGAIRLTILGIFLPCSKMKLIIPLHTSFYTSILLFLIK